MSADGADISPRINRHGFYSKSRGTDPEEKGSYEPAFLYLFENARRRYNALEYDEGLKKLSSIEQNTELLVFLKEIDAKKELPQYGKQEERYQNSPLQKKIWDAVLIVTARMNQIDVDREKFTPQLKEIQEKIGLGRESLHEIEEEKNKFIEKKISDLHMECLNKIQCRILLEIAALEKDKKKLEQPLIDLNATYDKLNLINSDLQYLAIYCGNHKPEPKSLSLPEDESSDEIAFVEGNILAQEEKNDKRSIKSFLFLSTLSDPNPAGRAEKITPSDLLRTRSSLT